MSSSSHTPESAARTRDRARDALVLAALALLLLALLHPTVLGPRGLLPTDALLNAPPWVGETGTRPGNYLLIDQFAFFAPVREFVHQRILQGDFPLWNPHLAGGVPTVASMQLALLYPLNLALAFVSPFASSGIAAFLKLLLAGAGTVLFMRRAGASRPAALLAAIVFCLSGFMIVWLGHPHVNSAALLPLLLYLVEGQFAEGASPRGLAALALAFAAMLLGGHPPSAVLITLAIAFYASWRLATPGTTRRPQRAALLALALAAGVVAASVQLFPFLEYYRESSLPVSSALMDRWSKHLEPGELVYFLAPLLGGSPAAGHEELHELLGLAGTANFNERCGYAGVLTLFLAAAAVAFRRGGVVAVHVALGVLAILMILGVPPLPWIQQALPVLDSVTPTRMLLVAGWCLAVLAGFGLDTVVRMAPHRRARLLAALFALLAAALAGTLWQTAGQGILALEAGEARDLLARQAAVLGGGVAVALALCTRFAGPRLACALCLAWTATDLLWFARGYNPSITSDQYFPPSAAIDFLRRQPDQARVLGLSIAFPANTAAAYGLDDARGVDFMVLRRYEELVSGKVGNFAFWHEASQLPPPFRLLNVGYVLTPVELPQLPEGFDLVHTGDMAVYRFRHTSPRAQLVQEHEVVRDRRAMLERLRSMAFDPARRVLLETEPAPVDAEPDGAQAGPGSARITRYEPDRIDVEVDAPRSAFLLLLDNDFPGWQATLDGAEVPILRADYSFRAVQVPAGRSVVEFRYRPLSFHAGLAVSLAALLGLLAVVVLGREPLASATGRSAGPQRGSRRAVDPKTVASASR
jgi:hypothetical protein